MSKKKREVKMTELEQQRAVAEVIPEEADKVQGGGTATGRLYVGTQVGVYCT